MRKRERKKKGTRLYSGESSEQHSNTFARNVNAMETGANGLCDRSIGRYLAAASGKLLRAIKATLQLKWL